MSVEIKVPSAGESVTEVEVGEWLKEAGDAVRRDESIAVLETDKASMELSAPADGTLAEILRPAGETVAVGEVIGRMSEAEETNEAGRTEENEEGGGSEKEQKTPAAGGRRGRPASREPVGTAGGDAEPDHAPEERKPRPSGREQRREGRRNGREPIGRRPAGGASDGGGEPNHAGSSQPDASEPDTRKPAAQASEAPEAGSADGADEELVPMSLLRRGIAKRLVAAQHEAALLTTFNEIDTGRLAELRERWGGAFERRHGVALGIMSIFVKAVVEALKGVPELNAEIRGRDIAYHRRYHVGIAVGSSLGLVVPVLRDVDRMSLAEIEEGIDDFAERAEADALDLDDLQGGTFTITNGGVFGSLLSTPIVSPPQSGVLGMHAIQERPVARDGELVLRPMMYVALTYDHRLVDGHGAVGFLRRVKEIVEAPERLLLEA